MSNIGAVGGSLTKYAINGSIQLGGVGFWTNVGFLGGGHLHAWADDPRGRYWPDFDARIAMWGMPEKVWWQILLSDHGGSITPEDRAALTKVSETIRAKCPDAEILASPMPDHWPRSMCPVPGKTGYNASVMLAERAVTSGLADRLGPAMPPITEAMTVGEEDRCHQGELGMEVHGRVLMDFPWEA